MRGQVPSYVLCGTPSSDCMRGVVCTRQLVRGWAKKNPVQPKSDPQAKSESFPPKRGPSKKLSLSQHNPYQNSYPRRNIAPLKIGISRRNTTPLKIVIPASQCNLLARKLHCTQYNPCRNITTLSGPAHPGTLLSPRERRKKIF